MSNSSDLIVFVPVIVMIFITIKSKKVLEPIVFSTLLCYILKYGFDFLEPFVYGIISIIRSESFAFIMVMLFCFGAVIFLIDESGGIVGLSRGMSRKIKSETGSLLMTWFLGLTLFMDDYLNSLIVGTSMKTLTDRHKVPREMISTIAISTGVPICILAPISSWAVFHFGVLKQNGIDVSKGLINTHFQVVPFIVYPFVCILGSLLLILGIIPKIGSLKEAYKRLRENNEGKIENLEKSNNDKNSIWSFIIPMATLIIVSIITTDVAIGGVCGLASCLIVFVLSKRMSLGDFVEASVTGMNEMLGPLIFMLFAFLFGEILTEMGFATTVIQLIEPFMIGELIPLLVFLLVSIIVFGGVDVWAVMPLVIPILLPLSQVFGINIFLCLGAMLSGICFGTQTCFISESHILISGTLNLRPSQQVMAHMPYAFIYATMTSIIYLVLGFTL